MKQRKEYKQNTRYRRTAAKTGIFLVVCLLLFGGGRVSAAPAALESSSSVVYEAADENSNPIGSLVQGNTFELNETITAENGDRWHLITMSNGVQGYMKGEVSMENGEAAPADENDGAEEPGAEDADGEDADPDPEAGEGEADHAIPGVTGSRTISSNTQQKTYSIQADADRIKVQVQPDQIQQDTLQQRAGIAIDKTLILLICVLAASIVLIRISCKRLKRMLYDLQRYESPSARTGAENRKAKKRRKAKRARKKRAAKEAKKWKKNNLQNLLK